MNARAVIIALLLVLVSCGGGAGPGEVARRQPPLPASPTGTRTFAGTIRYEARAATPSGASQTLSVHPARRIEVVLRGANGAVIASGLTDDDGHFSIEAPRDARELAVITRVHSQAQDVAVTRDPIGAMPHELRVAAPPGEGPVAVDIVARDADPAGFAGALHIADTALRGVDATRAWTGRELPPLFVYWGRGVTTEWSFFRGERPAGSGRYMLELLGGEPGRQASTDTDEHDEGIILHEVGHFVMDRVTGDSSTGGDHPTGYLIDPGLAWEEGRATWFATSVLGAPNYRDTIGIEPGGSLRLDHDLERGGAGPHGNGSEQSVSSVLWDLADGVEGVPDTDHDGVALGPAAVLNAMMTMAQRPGSFPCLSTFLRHLVTTGVVPELQLKQMLVAGGQPQELLPSDDVSPWPIDVTPGSRVSGKIDGLTSPAPSGGNPRPANGFDALRVYRVQVQARARLTVRVRIAGSGRGADHADVDLELRDMRAELLDASRGEGPIEAVSRVVEPGWYVIYARDGGQGNRIGYDLDVDVVPAGPS